MADFTPVALGIQKQEGMSLGDMVNIARGAQAYRQAEQVNPLALEQAQEATKQTKLKTETDTMGLQQKRFKNIADSQISMINNPLIIAAEQNPSAVDPAKLADIVKRNGMTTAKALGIPEDQANQLLAPYIEMATTNPAGLRQYYKERHIQGLDEGARTSALSASGVGVNTGAGGYTVQTGEFGPQRAGTLVPGTAYTSQLGPNQTQEPTGRTDNAGNPTAYVKDAYGNILGEVVIPAGVQRAPQGGQSKVPQGGQPAQPQVGQQPANAPMRMPFENTDTITAARNIQLKANQAASNVQTSQFNNNKIVELADKALVGANAETLSKLGGGYAIAPWTSDATQNRQILGHQLALETATLASGAGLGTDAARGLAEKMSGTTDWTPEAIKSTARMNRALTTGTDMFNRGVNAAVQASGNNPIAARDFQNKWGTQEQLVPTLQFVDALRNAKSDPAGAKAVVDSLGGYGSDGYKQMLQRAGKLNELITKGK